jgi:dihydrofolate reductase
MRNLIVLSFVSLDGVMQAPGGPDEDTSGNFTHGGWTVPYFDEFAGKLMAGQMSRPAELLLGRKTFDIFESYWPQHEQDWPGINTMRKHVASNTRSSSDWNNTVFLNGDVAGKVRKLKEQDGPDLQVHGSGDFIQTLLKDDLVDEFWLKIFPLTLGQGKRLFGSGTMPAAFTVSDSQTSPTGVIVATYKRSGPVKTGSF